MPIKLYKKLPPTVHVPAQSSTPMERFTSKPTTTPQTSKKSSIFQRQAILPAIFITIGSMLLANVIWPIISYQLFISPTSSASEPMLSGTPSDQEIIELANAKALPTVTPKKESAPIVIEEELEYINLAQWFPWQEIPQMEQEKVAQYTIDIPSLNIYNAIVNIGGLNLDKSLIQYPGTANPGELGSPVIFGHSVSPLFYNPSESNKRRYVSIFTKIMNLKKDDKIIVRYDGITYTYRVTNKMEVQPEDTYILSQRHDVRELKLITCTPPGTYLRRGIVFAQLENLE